MTGAEKPAGEPAAGSPKQHCIDLRLAGHSLRLIAQQTGLSQSSVRYHVRGLSVTTRFERGPRGRKPKATAAAILPSEDFAYLLGVFAGDGYLTRLPRTYKLGIACDNRHPELIAKYAALVERVLGRPPAIHRRSGSNCSDVVLYDIQMPALLSLRAGRKTDSGFTVPEWVFSARPYLAAVVRGLIETDGGIYKRHRPDKGQTWECIFAAYNPQIMGCFLRAAVLLGYRFHQHGTRASLSNTAEVRRLATDLQITKCCDYGRCNREDIGA